MKKIHKCILDIEYVTKKLMKSRNLIKVNAVNQFIYIFKKTSCRLLLNLILPYRKFVLICYHFNLGRIFLIYTIYYHLKYTKLYIAILYKILHISYFFINIFQSHFYLIQIFKAMLSIETIFSLDFLSKRS